ncbi:MAG: 50S ribosomal protein L18 [Saprospiraceae bacterium]
MISKAQKKQKIKYRIRKKISGSSIRPRLSVFRSNKAIYCQLIDDKAGITLAQASSKEVEAGANKTEAAKNVGTLIAEKAKSIKVDTVVFDRNGYLYHGRVKSLADGARDGGLKF